MLFIDLLPVIHASSYASINYVHDHLYVFMAAYVGEYGIDLLSGKMPN